MSKVKPWHKSAWLMVYRTGTGNTGTISEISGHIRLRPRDDAPSVNISELCQATERPWADNLPYESCAPDGLYPLNYRAAGKFYERYNKKWGHPYVLEYDRVPNRDLMLLHVGNDPMKDSNGCILPCQKATFRKDGTTWGTASVMAYGKLMQWVFANRPAFVELRGLSDLV